jgi:hypothetical protein
MLYKELLPEAANRLAALLRKYRASTDRVAFVADMSARELREYGLRCCPLGSAQHRRVYDLRLLGF